MAEDVTAGFHPLKPGRIHMKCSTCGRKQSNMTRQPHDPPNAVLLTYPCTKCADTAMEPPTYYFDAQGNEIVIKGYQLDDDEDKK